VIILVYNNEVRLISFWIDSLSRFTLLYWIVPLSVREFKNHLPLDEVSSVLLWTQ
jgi:hypothetical protein